MQEALHGSGRLLHLRWVEELRRERQATAWFRAASRKGLVPLRPARSGHGCLALELPNFFSPASCIHLLCRSSTFICRSSTFICRSLVNALWLPWVSVSGRQVPIEERHNVTPTRGIKPSVGSPHEMMSRCPAAICQEQDYLILSDRSILSWMNNL